MGRGSVRPRAEIESPHNPRGRRRVSKHHAGGKRLEGFGCPVPTDRCRRRKRTAPTSIQRGWRRGASRKHPERNTCVRVYPRMRGVRACCVSPRGAKQRAVGVRAFARHVPNDWPRWTRMITGRLNAAPSNIIRQPPSWDHWLVWIVYSAELGYRYTGDGSWQTFEQETRGWKTNGNRSRIREFCRRFRRRGAFR